MGEFPVSGRVELDVMDRKILMVLQVDAARSISAVSIDVGLSVNACWRRIKRLEDDGLIRKRVALLDARKLGIGMTVFVSIHAAEHSENWLECFARAVEAIPEIVELHRLSGDVDYMMKILVTDVPHYDRVYKRLIRSVKLAKVTASFSMEQIKETTSIPLQLA
jgi:Lrp/AsnC family transcriptional regulator